MYVVMMMVEYYICGDEGGEGVLYNIVMIF